MSTSPLGIPLSQDAPNSGPVTVAMGMRPGAEPTGYLLVPIRKGADFSLYRGQQHGNPSPVLVVAPTAEQPSPESLRRLAHEFSLASEIDPEWAAKPLGLTRHEGRTILVLKDPGGAPLDQVLNLCQGQPFDLKRALRIAIGLTTATSARFIGTDSLHKGTSSFEICSSTNAGLCVWLTGFGIASRLPRERQVPAPR